MLYATPEIIIQKIYRRPLGTGYFHILENKLYANASLDRDVIGPPGGPGPYVEVEVRCIVWEEKTGRQYVQTNVLTIDILDQDDNPPTVQSETTIDVDINIKNYQDFMKVSTRYRRENCKSILVAVTDKKHYSEINTFVRQIHEYKHMYEYI